MRTASDRGTAPRLHLRWRRSRAIGELLAAPPAVGYDGFVPEPCVLHPEQVTTYPFAGLLPEDLRTRIDAREDALEEAAELGADDNEADPVCYQYDLSMPPGWRVGGYASWHTTDPYPVNCRSCRTPTSLLLTVDSSAWAGGSGSWKPLEDRDLPAHRYATPRPPAPLEHSMAHLFAARPGNAPAGQSRALPDADAQRPPRTAELR
ncbi:hypothetical protein [Streptomyces sp. TLI_171]|uniref:hypothetical protein n=1 Tax=Streptomyces sp. TLI_171 TaxID=1938859 RepID=UPI000C5CEE57|nr:hypothetical protein [Streptomyces sp. TLI_171]RKE23616.1 hypothetical protein BX266_7101 [Streptomyces sp. TLI_171]